MLSIGDGPKLHGLMGKLKTLAKNAKMRRKGGEVQSREGSGGKNSSPVHGTTPRKEKPNPAHVTRTQLLKGIPNPSLEWWR
jgi:hypothetical protein